MIKLGALGVEDLALTISILYGSCTDLDTALVQSVGVQLQASIVLVSVQSAALVASMVSLSSVLVRIHVLRLVVHQDIADALATSLVLGEASDLRLYVSLGVALPLTAGACSILHAIDRVAVPLETLGLAILQTISMGSGEHHALAILGGSSRRLVEVEDTLRLLPVLVAHLGAGGRRSECLDSSVLLLQELVLLER